jgi:hypothetical protein
MRRLTNLSVLDLLGRYSEIMQELRRREITRTGNNPVADYAERLACTALKLSQASSSTKGYDATDNRGFRYEIKARRATPRSKPTRFSAIRDLPAKHFTHLVAIVFEEDFRVRHAAIITHAVVAQVAFKQDHVNGWILPISESLWSRSGVEDVTTRFQAVEGS